MKTRLLAVGLLLCCLLVALGSQSQPKNKQWEYHMALGLSSESANQLGQQGWELVTASPPEPGSPFPQVWYIFKRPRQ